MSVTGNQINRLPGQAKSFHMRIDILAPDLGTGAVHGQEAELVREFNSEIFTA